MKFILSLFLLAFATAPAHAATSAATVSSKVSAQSNEGETRRENQQEKEYVESKLFPRKGKYLDWIAANKLSNQGVRLARAGQYRKAIPHFQKAIQRYGFDYTYYENLGAALQKIGNLERAETTTEMAAQMAPRRWGPWYNLGLILTKQHEYKRALVALKKAKALKAPPSKTAGINRLITALELKLAGSSSVTAATPSVNETKSELETASEAEQTEKGE